MIQPGKPTSFTRSLTDDDWKVLVQKIKAEACVPFIGMGVTLLPMLSELAEQWAKEFRVRLVGKNDLPRLAQYMSMRFDEDFPANELCRFVQALPASKIEESQQLYKFLADLPARLYVTTSYDNFMYQAITDRTSKDKKPRMAFATWDASSRHVKHELDDNYVPSYNEPLVYHLNGHVDQPASLVLKEDDYLDFLSSIHHQNSEQPNTQVVELCVDRVLSRSSWLLLGYQLEDWDFRILLRFLDRVMNVNKNMHVSIQLYPFDSADEDSTQHAIQYLDRYFGDRKVRVFWGSVEQFMAELKKRLGK